MGWKRCVQPVESVENAAGKDSPRRHRGKGFVSGHGFSRAKDARIQIGFSRCKRPFSGAKAPRAFSAPSARLKTCPDTKLFRRNALVQNRRQKRPCRLVVQTERHQRQRLNDFKAMVQAPAKQFRIPRGQQEAWSSEFFCCSDQRLHVGITLSNCMTEEANLCRVSRNPPIALHDTRCAPADSIGEFA